jgi:WD40 repeat protein
MDVLERNNAQEKLVEEDPEAFESDITCLQLVSTSEVHGDLVFVGYEDGSVRVWSADTLDLVTSLSASAAPIKRILVTDYEKSKQLKNKVLFISEDGDITVFGLSEMRS